MPRALVIPAGQRFRRLVVVREMARGLRGTQPVRRFKCRCDCGRVVVCVLGDLRGGDTASCGCLLRETRLAARPPVNITHGHARHDGSKLKEYAIWQAMKDRCLNRRNRFYYYYGGRGITVCDEWRSNFLAFLNHIGLRPDPKLQLDRIDNNRGYEPGNVRWATKAQQMANRRQYKKRNTSLSLVS